jgi:hypothetical protein
VASGAGEILTFDEGGQDRHTASLLVEKRHRRRRHALEWTVGDREGVTGVAADTQAIAGAGSLERAEVDPVDAFARGCIGTDRCRLSRRNGLAVRIGKRPRERLALR